jgi:hypothetical protein
MSPAKKRAFSTPFSSAFAIASATAASTISTPQTSPACAASDSPIVPMPQKRSKTRSEPVSPAYSAATE